MIGVGFDSEVFNAADTGASKADSCDAVRVSSFSCMNCHIDVGVFGVFFLLAGEREESFVAA